MTNAQKWVTLFLGLFLLLFILGRITKEEEGFDEDYEFYNESNSQTEKIDGLTLINQVGCVSCHGADLKGTSLGPTLYDAKDHFSRKQLIGYLRNPASYSGDERFEAYKEKYKSLMPSYNNIEVEKLGIIADYLLNLE
jgi:mono/diheme cytochrome c family protein